MYAQTKKILGFFVCTGAAHGAHKPNDELIAEAGKVILYKGKNLGIKSRTGALVDATASFLNVIAQDDGMPDMDKQYTRITKVTLKQLQSKGDCVISPEVDELVNQEDETLTSDNDW